MGKEDGFKMSRKQKRIRCAVVVCVLTTLVLLVIIAVVLLIVLVPKSCQATLSPAVRTTAFNITYCPSADDMSCCPSPVNCQFEWLNPLSFTLQQVYTVEIENKNFLPIKTGEVSIILLLGGTEIARGSLQSERVKKRTKKNLEVTVAWRASSIDQDAMKDMICELAGYTRGSVTSNPDKNLAITAQVQMKSAKYLATPLKFEFGNSELTTSLKTQCNALTNKCEIPASNLIKVCAE